MSYILAEYESLTEVKVSNTNHTHEILTVYLGVSIVLVGQAADLSSAGRYRVCYSFTGWCLAVTSSCSLAFIAELVMSIHVDDGVAFFCSLTSTRAGAYLRA